MNKIESIISNHGLFDYKWIDPKEIIVAHWVRVKCTFGCNDYGLGTCPPNTPSVDDCRSFFNEYENGILFRMNKYADKNAYPTNWSKEMTHKLLSIERDIFLSGHQKTFLLNQTCCSLCENCSGNRNDCKDKQNSRPSPESFAVDVYQTVLKAGLKLNVVENDSAEISRIAILLIN